MLFDAARKAGRRDVVAEIIAHETRARALPAHRTCRLCRCRALACMKLAIKHNPPKTIRVAGFCPGFARAPEEVVKLRPVSSSVGLRLIAPRFYS